MRYIVGVAVLVLLILAGAFSQITLNKATAIAQKALDLETIPQSNPAIPSVVDNTSYYIIEFDNYWLPVRAEDGNYSKEFDDASFEAVKLHQAIQFVYLARSNEGYPHKLVNNLVLLQGNVQSKISFYESYVPQLPDELRPSAEELLGKARDLDDTIGTAIEDLNALKGLEDGILSSWIDPEKLAEWKKAFAKSVSDLTAVAQAGYEFEDARSQFVNLATAYVQNESNDLESRNLVANFVSNSAINGVPSTLGQYENQASTWLNWLNTVMSNTNIESKARERYQNALDRVAYVDVRSLKIEAYTKVSLVKTSFEDLQSNIGYCINELPSSKRKKYEEAEEYYNKSIAMYNKGSILLNQSDYQGARQAFQDAIGWAEKAGPLITELSELSCPEKPPEPETPGYIEFVQKNWVYLVGGLLALMVLIYIFTRPKKPREEPQEYYPEDYEDYMNLEGDTGYEEFFGQ